MRSLEPDLIGSHHRDGPADHAVIQPDRISGPDAIKEFGKGDADPGGAGGLFFPITPAGGPGFRERVSIRMSPWLSTSDCGFGGKAPTRVRRGSFLP